MLIEELHLIIYIPYIIYTLYYIYLVPYIPYIIYTLCSNSDYPKTPNWFKNTSKMRIGHTNLIKKK